MPETTTARAISDQIADAMRVQRVSQARIAELIGVTQGQVSGRLRNEVPWRLAEVDTVARFLGIAVAIPRDAGMSVPGLLAVVALAFILAAGLPAHAAVPLLVAAFLGHLFGRLLGAEVSTWGTPANARHRDGLR